MIQQDDIKMFDEISEKSSTWIIKYCSATFDNPLFLVWYTDTDEDSTDRLLTYEDGEIFAVKSLTNLKATILSSADQLSGSENLNTWLDNFNDLEVTEYCTYDLISIENEIDKHNLGIETIEGLSNFINLFSDFANQDKRNTNLQVYVDDELIREVWDYFYDFIFWPRFNDKEKFEAWDRPPLVIDTKELSVKLVDIIRTFDNNIKIH